MSMPKAKVKKQKGSTKKVRKPPSPPPDDDLPNLTYYHIDEEEISPERRDIQISFDMIVRRNLAADIQEMSHQEIVEALHSVRHIRLDREMISHIDNLEMLGSDVTNLYLQQNRIHDIENLESLYNLEFLTLSGNEIQKVENLKFNEKLKFLDLSNNNISEIDFDELPKSVMLLWLSGNPCAEQPGYRDSVIAALPNLRQLDGVDVDDVSGSSGSDDEDSDDGGATRPVDVHYPHRSVDEYISSVSVNRPDVFHDVVADIRQRSQIRVREMNLLHHQHREQLSQIRENLNT